jgi:hypothetical protein
MGHDLKLNDFASTATEGNPGSPLMAESMKHAIDALRPTKLNKEEWNLLLKRLGLVGKINFEIFVNQEMKAFFNVMKMPFLVKGVSRKDFGVSINRVGTNPETKKVSYEFELYMETEDQALNEGHVKVILARVNATWNGRETTVLSKEIVDPELKDAYQLYHQCT